MEGNFLVEFFPPTPRTKSLSHAKKESLFFEPLGCLISEKCHPQKPSGSPEPVLENFRGLFSPLRPNRMH